MDVLLFERLSGEDGIGEHTGVGVFEGRAGGEAAGEAGDFDACALEERADIEGGAVADHIGICCHNNFFYAPCFDAFDEFVDGEVSRLNAV